jgi:hypothetical protein
MSLGVVDECLLTTVFDLGFKGLQEAVNDLIGPSTGWELTKRGESEVYPEGKYSGVLLQGPLNRLI